MLSAKKLKCKNIEVTILDKIDKNIVKESLAYLKSSDIEVEFNNLYYECARAAIISIAQEYLEKIMIISDYNHSAIWTPKGFSIEKINKLKKLGFAICHYKN